MPPPGVQPRKPNAPSAATKEANEYIPSFISKKPFYIGEDDDQNDYLEHQRLQKAQLDQSKWYDRGKKLGPAATKFRKGACENCGAMTHKTKECLSRPRAKGARWTGKDIQADEVVQDVDLGWDAKRDRWNGYDPKEYSSVVDEYTQLEELKKKAALSTGPKDEDDDAGEDGAKYAEESDMGRHQSTATRQLRLREDTANYLLNLDLDSAKYDPKTRTMVDSGATADTAAALVAEQGFMRASGDAAEFEKAQQYAWESQEKAGDSKQHLQANPTAGEYYRRKEKEEAEAKKEAHRIMLLEKYGGEVNPLAAKLRETAVNESEKFIEYDETGAIKGAPKVKAKSKYPEDVLINNHTSTWGSWWSNFSWGYGCCHSQVKNSYCTGEAGRQAFEEADRLRTGGELIGEEPAKEIEWPRNEVAEKPKDEAVVSEVAKKRTMEEMKGGVSEEDMEQYKKQRMAANDPMAAFLGKDELL
ncbi:Pre-mRNA-splicing-factor SLU7-like protein [Venustampulla echinocandica]|uniref:Pre-mRNA-splicing factor SLU7 n=1 Tax=Venustampulla echinocandica TaxID=2656787 RepID=A0A370TKJ1_9HELO|nr:Pre-mRNA-splicing-factor SLU7-like protein [Venustampulla echinocandica]RDL36040.1 Pre-mRNA-splicing-factor SLU7-like protein [Venustampulla echinocandica]